jgi:hypothetical protein
MAVHATLHYKNIHMMKGEQQKIVHKGSNDKAIAFITLLYPYNGIIFNTTGKTRNSNDFINHIKNIKRCHKKRYQAIHFSY